MYTKWSEQLLTGNEIIDKQHKEIFEQAARMIESGKTGKIESEAGKIIEYLEGYYNRHFTTEEELQKKHGYPGYEAHKEMHQRFREELGELKHKLAAYGASPELTTESVVLMLEWLAKHIDKSDKILAVYIQNTQSGKSIPDSRPVKP
ncbi:MAG: bacteriohemerythrin [candidate division Zixibacteria bacterium]|nr:bacteriohemerythrin [candidate division Zixibacteria bacterium]